MRVLVAFDKFKDSISAAEAGEVARATLGEVRPEWDVDLCLLTDGGEGFVDALTSAARGALHPFWVSGPRGVSVSANVGLVSWDAIPHRAQALLRITRESATKVSSIAIVEMASASGLALLDPSDRDPWQTTSRGTGELIFEAARLGADGVLLGVGGSATNDLGIGALAALGVQFESASGSRVRSPTPSTWSEIVRIELGKHAALPPLRIACDVANPLLGDRGCTAIFAPQKGLKPDGFTRFEAAIGRMSALLCEATGQSRELRAKAGMGAAGGIGFGLACAADAQLLPGFELVSAWLELDARIARADVVITGEGRFDESSLTGKGPGSIARRAAALGKDVRVFAGQVRGSPRTSGMSVTAITPASLSLEEALPRTRELLSEAIRRSFNEASRSV